MNALALWVLQTQHRVYSYRQVHTREVANLSPDLSVEHTLYGIFHSGERKNGIEICRQSVGAQATTGGGSPTQAELQ